MLHDYLVIDAHLHLWEKQNGRVNGKPVFGVGGGKSDFGGEIRQMMPAYMDDDKNTAERLLANMDYAGVSGCVVTQEYIDGNQDEYLLECQRKYPKRIKIFSLYEENSPSSDILTQGRQTSDNVLATIHSHPMTNRGTDPATKDAQISSMGYLYSKGVFNGDALLKQRSLRNACYYTYFPKTQQLWSVGRYRPAFIRNIHSFSDFFFGTYNSK